MVQGCLSLGAVRSCYSRADANAQAEAKKVTGTGEATVKTLWVAVSLLWSRGGSGSCSGVCRRERRKAGR